MADLSRIAQWVQRADDVIDDYVPEEEREMPECPCPPLRTYRPGWRWWCGTAGSLMVLAFIVGFYGFLAGSHWSAGIAWPPSLVFGVFGLLCHIGGLVLRISAVFDTYDAHACCPCHEEERLLE